MPPTFPRRRRRYSYIYVRTTVWGLTLMMRTSWLADLVCLQDRWTATMIIDIIPMNTLLIPPFITRFKHLYTDWTTYFHLTFKYIDNIHQVIFASYFSRCLYFIQYAFSIGLSETHQAHTVLHIFYFWGYLIYIFRRTRLAHSRATKESLSPQQRRVSLLAQCRVKKCKE